MFLIPDFYGACVIPTIMHQGVFQLTAVLPLVCDPYLQIPNWLLQLQLLHLSFQGQERKKRGELYMSSL